MKPNETTKLVGRREALKVFGAGLTAASGLLALAASPAAAEGALSCKNLIEVDEAGTALRRSSQYKEKSPAPDKACTVCSQYLAAAHGACGGCRLMPGAVHPDGTCLSFAPKK